MAKFAAKLSKPIDVLVVGDHPCAYLAAMLLGHKSDLRVVHAPGESTTDDRLVTLNPAIFDLHPLLAGLKQRLPTTSIYGLNFLSDQADTASEHRAKSIVSYIARYSDVQEKIAAIFNTKGIESIPGSSVRIDRVDEQGLEVKLAKHTLHPRVLVLATTAVEDEKRLLGLPRSWEPDVVHRFTFVRCKSAKLLNQSPKALMPMSLDLRGQLCWGWLLPGDGEFQLAVEQPIEKAGNGQELLAHWAKVLEQHSVLGAGFNIQSTSIQTADLPLAGALAHEGVANRVLLIGPAGGFYSACGEEIYPSCWSSLFAADVLKKALNERHLQDALNLYRHKWRTTLGDYLRGPHQNLRFLLPLVYRNPAMTARIAEAILLSKSVVR
jgi:flavin-dependent dehydrogenase